MVHPELPPNYRISVTLFIQQTLFNQKRNVFFDLRCGATQFIELISDLLVATFLIVAVPINCRKYIHLSGYKALLINGMGERVITGPCKPLVFVHH